MLTLIFGLIIGDFVFVTSYYLYTLIKNIYNKIEKNFFLWKILIFVFLEKNKSYI